MDPARDSRRSPPISSTWTPCWPPTTTCTPTPRPGQRVVFGTSGHRGSSLDAAFNEDHILAITQAIWSTARHRASTARCSSAPTPTRCPSPATATALEVFAANGVTVLIDDRDGYTPTPAVSHAILSPTADAPARLADGMVVTPSHNPPSDGGFKYNPPNGGPADTDATGWIPDRANELLAGGLNEVQADAATEAPDADTTGFYDFIAAYVDDLESVSTSTPSATPACASAPIRWAGRGSPTGREIAERHRLDLTVVNPLVDPPWPFMTLDWDGKIRMDCSSPYAMASLVARPRRLSTSPPATTPTPTGTASSPRTAG